MRPNQFRQKRQQQEMSRRLFLFWIIISAACENLVVTSFVVSQPTALHRALLARSNHDFLPTRTIRSFTIQNDDDNDDKPMTPLDINTATPQALPSSTMQGDDATNMPTLDNVLKRARKKKVVIPLAMVQAFGDAPMFVLTFAKDWSVPFTRYDGFLVLVALALHANGFALGLILGKLTANPITKVLNPPVTVQLLLLPSWPVVWAIGLDQIM